MGGAWGNEYPAILAQMFYLVKGITHQ